MKTTAVYSPDEVLERGNKISRLLADTPSEICEITTPVEEAQWADWIVEKDRHALAAAWKTKADVLASLDCKHVLTETIRTKLPIPVQDTKEFLTDFGP